MITVLKDECQEGKCSENVAFREGTPRLNPKVAAPLTLTPAPLSPLATTPGCVVSGNTSVAGKRPWLSQLQGQSFKLLPETLAAWGQAFGSKLSAQSCLERLSEPVWDA